MPHDQAVKMAAALRDRMEQQVTTKDDLAKTEANLRAEFHKVTSTLIMWMAGILIAQGGVIVALVKLV